MTYELVACIVGLSNNYKEAFGTRPGVGKSCLCFRLAYPGYDNYVNSHPSVFALHEFEGHVINCNHFLYWGSRLKSYPVKGREVSVQFHIIEQTVVYHDVTSLPFNHITTKPNQVGNYIKRIIGPIESRGKMSYCSRDELAFAEHSGYKEQMYPQGITKIPRGFVVVFDVSLSGSDLEAQCNRLEPILQYLSKHKKKFIIAVTKRDCYVKSSLEKAYELQKNFRTHLVECSSSEDLNTEEVLRILARLILSKKVSGLSDHVVHYHDAAKYSLTKRGAARLSFLSFLKKKVLDCNEKLPSIQLTEEYEKCVQYIGVHMTGGVFAHHVLELYNLKVDSYVGVKENPHLRQEYLEDFSCQRSDLTNWLPALRKWITNHMKELPEQKPPLPTCTGLDPVESINYINQTDSIVTTTEQDAATKQPEGYLIFEPLSKVAKDAVQQEQMTTSLETAQDRVELAGVKTGIQQHTYNIQEDDMQPVAKKASTADDDSDLISDYSSASEPESLSDHDYLNVDQIITSMWSDTLTDDAPAAPEVKCKASQGAHSPSLGEENSNVVMKSDPDQDYVNLIDYRHEASKIVVQNMSPVALPAFVSKKIDGNGVQVEVKDQDMEDKMESTESMAEKREGKMECVGSRLNDRRKDMTPPETKKKEKLVEDVGVSQSHTCSTLSTQVEQTETPESSHTPKVLPKPSTKYMKTHVFPLPASTNTIHDASPKAIHPTPVRMSSLSSSCLDQLPSKSHPTLKESLMSQMPVSRHQSIRDRVGDLEKVIKSGCASSVASETGEKTDVVEDSGNCNTVNGASNASGVSGHGESDSSSSSSPFRKLKKPPPQVVLPRFALSAGADSSGVPTKYPSGEITGPSVEWKQNVGGRKNAEQLVEDKFQEDKLQEDKEVRSRAITISSPPISDANRPRLSQIRNKIAQRKSTSVYEDCNLQAMNKEGRANLAGIRKKLTEHKPDTKESLEVENSKPLPQHVVASELSIPNRIIEKKGREAGNKVTSMHAISQPVSPTPSGKLDLPPPLPSKPLAKSKVTTATTSERTTQSANMGGVGTGRLRKELVVAEEGGWEVSSPPPPIPPHTPAMFEIQQQPPDANVKANSYLNVSLIDASDTSISTATTFSINPMETAKSATKKKSGTFTKSKKEEVNQNSMKKKIVKQKKEQVASTTKSSFLRFPGKKTGQGTLKQKTELQTVESRGEVVITEWPLPELPGQHDLNAVPDHTDDDYEKFAFIKEELDYVNSQQLPNAVMAVSEDRLRRSRSQEPIATKTAVSTTLVKNQTLSRREDASRPVVIRQTSTDCPDYIDGYVNSNNLLIQHDAMSSQPLPTSPFFAKGADKLDDEEEPSYDYPDLHVVGAALANLERLRKIRPVSSVNSHGTRQVDRKSGMKGANRRGRKNVLDNEFGDKNSNSSSDYVHMANLTDNSYINLDQNATSDMGSPSCIMHKSTSDHNIVTGEGTSRKGEGDESHGVYMNLPIPERSIQLPIRQHSLHTSNKLQTGHSKVPSVKPKPSKIESDTVATTIMHRQIPKLTGAHSHFNTSQKEESERMGDLPPRDVLR